MPGFYPLDEPFLELGSPPSHPFSPHAVGPIGPITKPISRHRFDDLLQPQGSVATADKLWISESRDQIRIGPGSELSIRKPDRHAEDPPPLVWWHFCFKRLPESLRRVLAAGKSQWHDFRFKGPPTAFTQAVARLSMPPETPISSLN